MEQTKCYVKLYINRADEYQSFASLNPPAFPCPRQLLPQSLSLFVPVTRTTARLGAAFAQASA
jgi:hypothetical protein